MRRFLSLSKSSSKSSSKTEKITLVDSKAPITADDDEQSTTADSAIQPPPPTAYLKVKKVDHFYSRWAKKWKYTTSGSNVIPEMRPLPSEGKDDPWQQFCFVVVREIPLDPLVSPYFQIVVKSSYLLKACKDVVGEVEGVSWNAIPLELDPKLLISFLPQFESYRNEISAKEKRTEEDGNIVATVDVLIDYLRSDYRATIAAIENLTSHGEITFELLYALLVPRSIMVTENPLTGDLQALQVGSSALVIPEMGCPRYDIILEGIDVDDSDQLNITGFTRIQSRIVIPIFKGTMKITSLDAYPIKFHPQEAELRERLLERGRKWAGIAVGIHHMSYHGTGGSKVNKGQLVKYNLNSRVIIDRANFKRLNPNYPFPPRKPTRPQHQEDVIMPPQRHRYMKSAPRSNPHMIRSISPDGGMQGEGRDLSGIPLQVESKIVPNVSELTEDDLLITSPILYCFSLADKIWLELDVDKIEEIQWNDEAYTNLFLPKDRKMLLQSLVEAHNAEIGFDDFVKGKGRGLVVNLFGPPGVGKTLSAEATSEHVKRPLYVVGAGDLGTSAAQLDLELQRVFELATAWKAIVLIDEADVFLEQRSLHNLERNAMVAVFLRHLEYYPSILFLTTNRVKTFDEAFLSRIHIALHFQSLSRDARSSVWTAFIAKAGVKIGQGGGISDHELALLTERDINGRQVKNAVKTATSLAASRGETLGFQHLVEVLDVMEQFFREFENGYVPVLYN
ncbi:P-loop containing nucleoside triphosphate hydrolase protein [Hysterangium stoloniferum]|nr:P-loop containing nucleoside triphosphate hydrolase protein [Hysterangium stoloniferum]